MSNLNFIDVLNSDGNQASLTVGTSAVELKVGASPMDLRQAVTMQPKDTGVFWGYTSGVTTSTGTELFKDQFLMLPIGPEVSVYLVATGSGKEVRIGELA